MSCSNTGQDVAEALIPSPVLFPLSVGEPTHLPVQPKTCSVGFVVASTGAPLQRKEITNCRSSLLLRKPNSPENLSFVSEVCGGEMKKALLGHLLLRGALRIKTNRQEYSSQSCTHSPADCYSFVASMSRCGLGETCPDPQSTVQLPPALALDCNCRLVGVGQPGGLGVLCPMCSSARLACFGSAVSAVWLNLFLPFQKNSSPQVVKAAWKPSSCRG